jgi:L-lactate dehydrogenase
MRVSVVGTGTVGSALLYFLSTDVSVDEVFVMSRSEGKSRAAIMDVASACPSGAQKLTAVPYPRMSECDIVVLTSGATPEAVLDPHKLRSVNLSITEGILAQSEFGLSTTIIALATPVDDVTVFVQKITGLPVDRVMGFGGDLDRNRLASILLRRGKLMDDVNLVGEHGKGAIPVYLGEEDYQEVSSELRSYLATMITLSGPPKNLATAVLLGKLIASIATDARRSHNVCGYHEEFDTYLTWPFVIGRDGVVRPDIVQLGPNARVNLAQLVSERRRKAEAA